MTLRGGEDSEMAGGKFVVSGGKRMLESEERPKKKLKVAKGGKKAKGEEEDSEPKFESMKEHMVPIQYKESASDNFKWEDVPIDAKVGIFPCILSQIFFGLATPPPP